MHDFRCICRRAERERKAIFECHLDQANRAMQFEQRRMMMIALESHTQPEKINVNVL